MGDFDDGDDVLVGHLSLCLLDRQLKGHSHLVPILSDSTDHFACECECLLSEVRPNESFSREHLDRVLLGSVDRHFLLDHVAQAFR